MKRILAKCKELDYARFAEFPVKLDSIAAKYGSEIMLLAITVIFTVIYGDYVFFEKLFLHYGFTVDSITQFYPLFVLWIEKMRSLNFSPWSFQIDLGFNIYTLLMDLNPFDMLLLLADRDDFVDFLPFIMLLKFLAAGIFFHAFLRRLSISPCLALIGGLLYTFCGYMVINVHWYHYPNYAVLLAVVLYLFERWLQTGKWLPLALILGFLALKAELQIFQLTLFFLIYGGYRLAGLGLLTPKNYSWYVLKAGLLYTVGIGMSCYVLLPSLSKAGAEDRVGEALAMEPLHSRIAAFFSIDNPENLLVVAGRFFNNDIWGAFGNYKGFQNYFEGPSIYCGLLMILGLPAVLLLGKKAWTRGHIPLLLLLMLPLLFPQFRESLNFFASSTFKYQNLYFAGLLIIIISQVYTRVLRETKGLFVLALSAFLFAGVFYWVGRQAFLRESVVNQQILANIALVLVGYGSCFLIGLYRPLRAYLPYILLVCVCFETALWNKSSIEHNGGALNTGFHERGDYYHDPEVKQALAFIKQQDSGFYRIARSFNSGGLNDAMVQGYNGVSGYMGISAGITDFYTVMGFGRYSLRLSSYRHGLRNRVLLHDLLGVKYYLDTADTPLPGYRYLQSFGHVRVFANDNWLPLGFVQHREMGRELLTDLAPEQKDYLLLQGFVTSEEHEDVETIKPNVLGDNPLTPVAADVARRVRELRTQSLVLEEFSGSRIIGEVRVAEKGILGTSIPYDPGWHIRIDDQEVEKQRVNMGFLGAVIEPGVHRVEFLYTPRFAYLGAAISLILLIAVLLAHRVWPLIPLLPPQSSPRGLPH